MQSFNVINDDLVFSEAFAIFKFNIKNDNNDYLLFKLVDLNNGNEKLMISKIYNDGEYDFLKNIDDIDIKRVSRYINILLFGNESKKEIKISNEKLNFKEQVCQTINEKNIDIKFTNISVLEDAISNLDKKFFNSFRYINELNVAIKDKIDEKNNDINNIREKEKIKGNVNIFLLMTFAIIFLAFLIFTGIGLFFD